MPWVCTENKTFAAEAWCFSDQEILDDMCNLNCVKKIHHENVVSYA